MNEEMYQYFCDNGFLTHGIGLVEEKETFFKFESVMKLGGLMSKQKLMDQGIIVNGKAINYRITEECQISLFDPTCSQIKDRLLSKYYHYFLPFDPNVIFFIVDREGLLLEQNQVQFFELNENSGFISIENIRGIIAPSVCAGYLNDVQKRYGYNLPIYDFDFKLINSLDINRKGK